MTHIFEHKYISRLAIAISTVICMLSFSCCIEDVCLNNKEMVNSTVRGTQEGESITLKADMEGFAIHGVPTERGFVMTRTEGDWYAVDTVKVPLSGPFEVTINDDLWEGLDCKVYAYVKASEKKFRTADMSFKAKNGAMPIIKNVAITPDEYSVGGTIKVEGEHLTRFFKNLDVKLTKPVEGTFYATAGRCTNESIELTYKCCNVGEFGVIITMNGHDILLDKKIVVDCATLNNFSNTPVYGMPTPIDISTKKGEVKSIQCKLDHKNELTTKNTFYNDKKWYTAFVGKGTEHTATISFHNGYDEIFLPDEKVSFRYAWEKVAQTSTDFLPQTFGAGHAWEVRGDRDHPNLGVRLREMNPETGKIKEYKCPTLNNSLTINGYMSNFKAFYEDGNVYCMASYYTGDWWEDGYAYTKLWKFNVDSEKWTDMVDLRCDHQIGSQTYRSFAKVGNTFYFANNRDGKWVMWNSETKELSEGYSDKLKMVYDEFCGYDDGHFYYQFNELISISLNDFTTKKDVIANVHALNFKSEPGMCWCGVKVYNGLIYLGNIGMTQSISNMDEVTYYGLPSPEAHAQYMMPIDGELYYLMDNGDILKHKK